MMPRCMVCVCVGEGGKPCIFLDRLCRNDPSQATPLQAGRSHASRRRDCFALMLRGDIMCHVCLLLALPQLLPLLPPPCPPLNRGAIVRPGKSQRTKTSFFSSSSLTSHCLCGPPRSLRFLPPCTPLALNLTPTAGQWGPNEG